MQRPRAIITGAAGGMGRACARLLGATMDLVLVDVAPTLETFAGDLRADGYTVAAAIVGDQGAANVLRALSQEAARGFVALIHTGGLGPSAPWQKIIEVNYIATVSLLDAIEPVLEPGSTAVLIASTGGHMAPRAPEFDAALSQPFDPALLPRLDAAIRKVTQLTDEGRFGTLAYCLSKLQVLRLCEGRAAAWGKRGARIVTISPGMIFTAMGQMATGNEGASSPLVTSTPLGRWGTPMEIAATAAFLVSPAASFITGSDVLVDGGAMAMFRSQQDNAYAQVLGQQGANLKENAMSVPGLVTIESAHDFKTTLARLLAALAENKVTVFAQVDHAAGAAAVGLPLRPTTLVIFGNPIAGTPLMQANQIAGIDLPLKVLVWEDADRRAKVTYVAPTWIAERHDLGTAVDGNVTAMAGALSKLVGHATAP